jgi:hypothetical protein
MADICIIYARPSKGIAKLLYEILSRHHNVWWDEHIHSGDYRAEIERQLSQAKCVVPVWCRVSRADGDVVDEAAFAQRRSIPLLPVRIEDVDIPLGYGSLHTVDLIGWQGSDEHPGIRELLRNMPIRLTHTTLQVVGHE